MQIASTGSFPPVLTLTGVGLAGPNPSLALSTAALAFENTRVGSQSLPSTVRISSSGTGVVTVSAIAVTGAYGIDSSTCPAVPFSLPAGTDCIVSVSFRPTTEGTSAGTLSITSDAAPAVREVALSGSGESTADTSSGGCTIGDPRAPADPLLWTMVLIAAAWLFARRRQRRRAPPQARKKGAPQLIRRLGLAALLFLLSFAARAQLDYSAFGTLDLSYGRFENSGEEPRFRYNSNSLSASFVGVKASYGFENGWTTGINLETFIRFQDLDYGRNDQDPFLSRNNFVSLQHNDYGLLRIGRLQTYLFETSTRFNAFGNSTGFSPALRQIFLSGNLESVDGDFYWDRAISYSTPRFENGLQGSVMYALDSGKTRGDYMGGSLVFSRGVFAMAVVGAERAHQQRHRRQGRRADAAGRGRV